MASSVSSLSFFVFFTLFSSLHIEARGRLFFNKDTPSNNNYNANDPKLPLSYDQDTKLSPEVAAQRAHAQNLVVDPPKEPKFSPNQYGGYGLYSSTKDTSATTDTSSTNENAKENNNDGNNFFIYNMENASNGNGEDNIWGEIKQQDRSSKNGRYNVDKEDETKMGLNGYGTTARRGSTGNQGSDGVSGKQNDIDSLEEYEKYLQRRRYLP